MLIALLIVLGIADCVVTLVGIERGASEANPIAGWLFKLIGPAHGALLLKLACTGILVFVLHESPSWWPLGAAFVAGYVFVLWHNLKVIRAYGP